MKKYLVLELAFNLLLIHKWHGASFLVFYDKECFVYQGPHKIIGKGICDSKIGLYWCIIINPKFKIYAIASFLVAHLWHCCLGHLNQHNVKSMGLHHVGKGVPLILGPHDLCNNCQLGKQAHEPISKEVIHPWPTKSLILIHFDICGEIHLAYLGGNIFCHIH